MRYLKQRHQEIFGKGYGRKISNIMKERKGQKQKTFYRTLTFECELQNLRIFTSVFCNFLAFVDYIPLKTYASDFQLYQSIVDFDRAC